MQNQDLASWRSLGQSVTISPLLPVPISIISYSPLQLDIEYSDHPPNSTKNLDACADPGSQTAVPPVEAFQTRGSSNVG